MSLWRIRRFIGNVTGARRERLEWLQFVNDCRAWDEKFKNAKTFDERYYIQVMRNCVGPFWRSGGFLRRGRRVS